MVELELVFAWGRRKEPVHGRAGAKAGLCIGKEKGAYTWKGEWVRHDQPCKWRVGGVQ